MAQCSKKKSFASAQKIGGLEPLCNEDACLRACISGLRWTGMHEQLNSWILKSMMLLRPCGGLDLLHGEFRSPETPKP